MDEYYDYDYEPLERAFCDDYIVHEPHAYRAVNGNTYDCSGFDEADAQALRAEQNRPPCEHGLSASLCSGPSHYPMDM